MNLLLDPFWTYFGTFWGHIGKLWELFCEIVDMQELVRDCILGASKAHFGEVNGQ